MVDSPATVDVDLAVAAEILARSDGVYWSYELLADVAARHRLTDAWLVMDAGATAGAASPAERQLFALSGTEVAVGTARALLQLPAGLYGEPHGVDAGTNHVIGAMCTTAFRASVASLRAGTDPGSGLSSRATFSASIARAAACGARYGWSSTLVRLTTGGRAAPEDRWQALLAALPRALRSGDEAGVTALGVALALLGNAGPDAVRPFVARIRAALSAAGRDDIDLHAATAQTPEETVDPLELERLATERLADAGVAPTDASGATSELELELRLLPGVVFVAMATPVVVLSSSESESLHEQVLRAVRSRLPQASVRLLALSDDPSELPDFAPADVTASYTPHKNGHASPAPQESSPHAISATAPLDDSAAPAGTARVSLLSAAFDPERGTSEVSLAVGGARGTGRAAAGPLAGGAQATLNALRALSIDVPFYLVSAERAHGVPGEPVVVVLAPKRTGLEPGGEGTGTAVERLGVATGTEDVETASRATLGALNRHLARNPAGR